MTTEVVLLSLGPAVAIAVTILAWLLVRRTRWACNRAIARETAELNADLERAAEAMRTLAETIRRPDEECRP